MSSRLDPKHVVVIGAGITGLTSAYRLLKIASAADYSGPALTVTVVESGASVGGKIKRMSFLASMDAVELNWTYSTLLNLSSRG